MRKHGRQPTMSWRETENALATLLKLSIEDGPPGPDFQLFKHTQCPDCRNYHLGTCPFCAGWEPMPPNRGAR